MVLAAVLVLSLVSLQPTPVQTQIPDPCEPDATSDGGCLFVCPGGDGQRLDEVGATIDVSVIYNGVPVAGIPFNDFWLLACDPLDDLVLCGGSQSCSADGPTDADGHTTISGTIIAGGCANGLGVVIQGIVIYDKATSCTTVLCLPILARSPDVDGDLVVGLTDLSIFAASFNQEPYNECVDFDCNGTVGLTDLALFAQHFGPPGHNC